MPEFLDLDLHPGLFFVAATLLPLLSFVILLLAGALRTSLRCCRESGLTGTIYTLLGGDHPIRAGAYVATAAIGGAFLLCLIGFLIYSTDEHPLRVNLLEAQILDAQDKRSHARDDKKKEIFKKKIEDLQQELDTEKSRWSGRLDWAGVGTRNNETRPGSLLQVGYRIDHLSVIMFLMVTFIATLIHVFSIGYMSDELQPILGDHEVHTADGHLHRRGRFGRFFLFMSLFCFSMLNLILADNLFQVFVSWELVGICSYLLIGFYFERTSASNAANKAFIVNRVGDAGFIIGLLIVWTHIGTFNFEEIFKQVRSPMEHSHGKMERAAQIVRADLDPSYSDGQHFLVSKKGEGAYAVLFPLTMPEHSHDVGTESTIITDQKWLEQNPNEPKFRVMPYWALIAAGLGIFMGCVGKSAQFPLQVWLPDAMEGPTPVSALIHAATMVAAGVYLVGRVFPLFTMEALLVIAYTGAITLFIAATIAIVMTDIKKVLAYSTVSQLGYMMLALGIGGWAAGLFHLITHAFFKALLFLGSGSVIYGCHHQQDMLKMGGLYPKMKITALTMLMGVLAIAGTPAFSGWYSKDAIVAQALGFGLVYQEHFLLFLLPLVTAGITTFYMFRLWFMTFTGPARDEHMHEHAHESPWLMTTPLVILAFFSVTVAWGWPFFSAQFPFVDAHSSWLEHQIAHAQPKSVAADFGAAHGTDAHAGAHTHAAAGSAIPKEATVADKVHHYHSLAGNLALGVVLIGFVFAALVYYYRVLDPAEAKDQFPGLHRFLWNKWYFDELYSALLVRPALAVAGWCRWFDTRVIDGAVDSSARGTVNTAKSSGRFDLGIIDGLANLTARVFYGVGSWLRNVQTGYIRSYVLFLVLAAVGIWLIVSVLTGTAPTAGK
jgi:NADH-quinone oxidoreductase subunit L